MQTLLVFSLTFIVYDSLLLLYFKYTHILIGIFSLLSAFYDELRKLGLIQNYFVSPLLCPTALTLWTEVGVMSGVRKPDVITLLLSDTGQNRQHGGRASQGTKCQLFGVLSLTL